MTLPPRPQPDFDRIARPYRWLEYLAFGRSIERCRLHFLPWLAGCTRALVLGDGDGRFLAALLAADPCLNADAVDTSASMLALLHQRCVRAAPGCGTRLRTHRTDALAFISGLAEDSPPVYDLIATHFFLDCLTQTELDALAAAIAPRLAPNALWIVSDFRIPPGAMRIPARTLVRMLYLAFRILTGLRPTRLPDHAASLTRAGLRRLVSHRSFAGLLTTELWSVPPPHPPYVRMTTE